MFLRLVRSAARQRFRTFLSTQSFFAKLISGHPSKAYVLGNKCAAVGAASIVLLSSTAFGQTWNNAAGGTFATGSNWTPGAPTFSAGADETLNFGSFLNATTPGYTATIGTGAPVFTRVMNFNNTYGSSAITIATTGGLTFNSAGGNGAQLNQNGVGLINIGAFTMGSDLLIGGSGSGNLTVTGAITNNVGGGSVLTINQTGGGFANTGATIIFSTAGTWGATGTTVINGGNIAVGSSTALGAAATNTITFNAGSFRFNSTALTLANNFVLNNSMNVLHSTGTSGTNTFSGILSGTGGLQIAPVTGLTLALTGANTFSGDVVYRGLNNATGFGLTLSGANGSIANVNNVRIFSNSTLILDNTTAPSLARLKASASVDLNSARITHQGNATVTTTTAFGTLNTTGQAIITVNPGAASLTGAGSTLSIGTWNRTQNSTAFISAANLGNTPAANTSNIVLTNNPGGAVGGILPYAFANTTNSTTTGATNTFVRYDAATGRLVGLSFANDYQGGLPATQAMELYRNSNTTANYRATTNQAGLGNTTVNSLILDTSGVAAGFVGTSITGTGTLTVGSGAVMGSIFGGANVPTPIVSTIGVNQLAFGTNTAYIHAANNLNITSTITGSGGLVKSGQNILVLTGNNTFTGDVFLNAGLTSITADANLGAASNVVRLNSGNFNGLIFNPSSVFTPGNQTTLTTARNFVIGEAGGSVFVNNFNNTMNINGTVSGTGFFFKGGSGTLALNGTNTYSGPTLLSDGVLVAQNDASLGNTGGDIVFIQGGVGVLQSATSINTSRNVLAQSTAQFFTNGNNLTLNGVIGSQNNVTPVGMTKLGTGDLILTGTNTYGGATTIGGSGAVVRSEMSGAQTGGRVVLSGANGSIAMSSGITINNGATLRLDNSAAVNDLRVGRVAVTMNAGSLEIVGNGTANSSTAIGALIPTTFANTVTLDQSTGTGSTINALTVTSYTNPTSSQMTFIRGSNLGATSGNRAAMLFNTAPTTVFAGILPSMVGSNSATGSPTEFLKLGTAVGGQTPVEIFTAYSVNSPNAGATAVADLTTDTSLSAASIIGAARLSTGNLDLAGFGWNVQSGSLITSGTNTISNSGALASVTLGGTATGGGAAAGFGRITNTGALTIGPNVQISATNVTKFGAGDLILNQAAAPTATTWNIAQGTLRYGTGVTAALPTGSTVNLAPNALLDLNNNTGVVLASITGFGNVNVGSGGLTQSTNSGTFAGSLSGSGAMTLNGANSFTATGNSSGYSGNWNVNAGTLVAGSNNALGFGTINLGATTGTTGATFSLPSLSPNTAIANNFVVRNGSSGTKIISSVVNTSGTLSGNIVIADATVTGLQLNGAFSSTTLQPGAWNISGTISGTGNIDWFGGNWSLSGDNSGWGGNFAVNNFSAMFLGAGSDTAFGTGTLTWTTNGGMLRADNGARTLANNIVVAASTTAFSMTGVNDLTLNGTMLLNTSGGNHNVNILNTGVTTFGGVISGASATSSMSQTGFGTLVLSGTNTFAGGYTLNSGALGIGNNSALGTGVFTINEGGVVRAVGGDRTIANNMTVAGSFGVDGTNSLTLGGNVGLGAATRTIVVNNSADTTISGIISSAISTTGIFKDGSGTLNLTAANTYTGTTTVNNGVLGIGNNAALGTGAVQVNNGAVLRAVGADRTIANNVTLNGTSSIDGSNALTLNGTVGLGAATRTINVNNSATTMAGIISGAAGSGIIKDGSGSLNLTGANTYSGTTTVANGTLFVNNTTGSGTGSGSVVVNVGATLGGSGTILPTGTNTVTVNGILSPGNSPGTLTIGSLGSPTTFNLNGSYTFELATAGTAGAAANSGSSTITTGVSHDFLSVFGTMNFGAASTFNITSLGSTGFDNTQNYSWLVGSSNGGTINGSPTLGTALGTDFLSAPIGNFALGTSSNGNLFLNFTGITAVPEPSTFALIAAAGSVGWFLRRRKKTA